MTDVARVSPEVAFAAYPGILAYYAWLKSRKAAGNELLQQHFSTKNGGIGFGWTSDPATGKVLTALEDFERRTPAMSALPPEVRAEFDQLCAEIAADATHPEARRPVNLSSDF